MELDRQDSRGLPSLGGKGQGPCTVHTRWSQRMEPCSDWRLLKHMRRGWTGPPCWRRGSEAPRCWWPPGALGVGSHDPCLSRESWWICCWPRRRPHRIWLSHFWALGPELSLDDFEGLCPSWLKVISERSQLGCGGGAPHGCGNFHKDSDLQLECKSLAADTRQSMCSQ